MLASVDSTMLQERFAQSVRVVWHYWLAGGWLMIPLALVAFMIWCVYLMLVRRLHAALQTPESCIPELERRLGARVETGAVLEWLGGLPGAVPRVVRHLLARAARGLPFHEAFRQCRDAELAVYGYSGIALAAMVVAAPLLGLLGTVLGMVATFNAVAMRSGETATLVAGGISQALITTQVGLVAALPGAFGLAHIHRLYQRLANDLARCESHLYVIFEKTAGVAPNAGG